jgi:hypothetical protein
LVAAVVLDERRCGSVKAARIAEHAVASLVEVLEPDAVPLADATELWRAYDGIERLAARAKTILAARVEAAGDWKRAGARSAAEHLAKLGGTTAGVARRSLETSRHVAELPAVSAALRGGALSSVQVEAIASAAAANPSAEQRLLEVAETTNVHELREECLRTRASADPDLEATNRRIHAGRHLRTHTNAEGAWNLSGPGTAEQGARFEAILEPKVDELFVQARADGRREPREAYVFDALMSLIDSEPMATRESRRTKPRYLALLHIDVEALTRGQADHDEKCEIVGIGPIPVVRARELLGDSISKLVITKGVDVANVVHLGRGPTAAQRIALMWSKPKCANEACSRMLVEIDHNTPWALTKRTVLGDLDPLCLHDHDLKTNHGWSLVEGKGRRRFVPPDHPQHPRNKPPP